MTHQAWCFLGNSRWFWHLARKPVSHCSTSFLPCIVLAKWQAKSPEMGAISVAKCVAIADWTRSNDEHAAAYSRAGLPQWAAECLSEPGHPSDFASQAAPPPAMALRPAAVVQATVSDVMLTLPYDQDFGRAERFGELWSKAFGQVCCCIWLCCSPVVVPLPSGCVCLLGLFAFRVPLPSFCPFAFWVRFPSGSLGLLGPFAFWVQLPSGSRRTLVLCLNNISHKNSSVFCSSSCVRNLCHCTALCCHDALAPGQPGVILSCSLN